MSDAATSKRTTCRRCRACFSDVKVGTMTPGEIVAKRRAAQPKERSPLQEYMIDLSHLPGVKPD